MNALIKLNDYKNNLIDLEKHMTDRLAIAMANDSGHEYQQELFKHAMIINGELAFKEDFIPVDFLQKALDVKNNPKSWTKRKLKGFRLGSSKPYIFNQKDYQDRLIILFIEQFGIEEGLYKHLMISKAGTLRGWWN